MNLVSRIGKLFISFFSRFKCNSKCFNTETHNENIVYNITKNKSNPTLERYFEEEEIQKMPDYRKQIFTDFIKYLEEKEGLKFE